jgi:hypothetical protein
VCNKVSIILTIKTFTILNIPTKYLTNTYPITFTLMWMCVQVYVEPVRKDWSNIQYLVMDFCKDFLESNRNQVYHTNNQCKCRQPPHTKNRVSHTSSWLFFYWNGLLEIIINMYTWFIVGLFGLYIYSDVYKTPCLQKRLLIIGW